jgi:hypothetical protein
MFSLISLCQVDPACQLHLPPRASRRRIPPRPATPRRPAPHLEWLPHALTCPTIKTPSLTLPLTSPSSMALKTLTPPIPPGHPSPARPTPYKRRAPPPDLNTPFTLSPEPLRALLRPCDELKLPPFFTAIARPPHCCPCPGEQPIEFPVSPSPCCTPPTSPSTYAPRAGKAPRAQFPRHPQSTVDPSAPSVHLTVDSVHGISCCKLNPGIPLFLPLCKKAPVLLEYQPAVQKFS